MADYPTDLETEDWRDFQEEQRDRQEEAWDEIDDGFPTTKKSETLFSLFKDVWKTKDSTKVANINPKTELGDLGLSVRHMQKMSVAAILLNEQEVGDWMDSLGEITLSTSMAKNGWFTELFVSTKKFAQKAASIQNLAGAEKKTKWRLFGSGKKETTTEEQ